MTTLHHHPPEADASASRAIERRPEDVRRPRPDVRGGAELLAPAVPGRRDSGRVARLVRRIRRRITARLPGGRRRTGTHDAERFWVSFELQLESARRHQRTFSVSRMSARSRAGSDVSEVDVARLLDDISRTIRRTDAVAVVDDDILVLWSEIDERHVDSAIGRFAEVLGVDPSEVTTAAFPRDGITAASLFDALTPVTAPSDHTAPGEAAASRPWTST